MNEGVLTRDDAVAVARSIEDAISEDPQKDWRDSLADALELLRSRLADQSCAVCGTDYMAWDGHAGCCSITCQQRRMEYEDEAREAD